MVLSPLLFVAPVQGVQDLGSVPEHQLPHGSPDHVPGIVRSQDQTRELAYTRTIPDGGIHSNMCSKNYERRNRQLKIIGGWVCSTYFELSVHLTAASSPPPTFLHTVLLQVPHLHPCVVPEGLPHVF